jgi:hypothetical protein
MCDQGTCTAPFGPGGYDCDRQRAFCPGSAPTAGSDCCNAEAGSACEATCLASTFGCRYDQCRDTGEILSAACRNGSWEVSATPCPECPVDCAAGEACVRVVDIQTTATCAPNPCAPGVVDQDCAGHLCEPTFGTFDAATSGGDVVTCSVAHSAGP